jgi:Ca2+-binding RTX toxin-like protein
VPAGAANPPVTHVNIDGDGTMHIADDPGHSVLFQYSYPAQPGFPARMITTTGTPLDAPQCTALPPLQGILFYTCPTWTGAIDADFGDEFDVFRPILANASTADQVVTVDMGAGNDVFAAGNGTDIATGGDGDDTLTASAGRDTLDGGPGTDTADYGSASTPIVGWINAAQPGRAYKGALNPALPHDTLLGVERLFGSQHGDLLMGFGGFYGAPRLDVRGQGGNDVLVSGSTNLGNTRLDGGAGVDRADAANGGHDRICTNVETVNRDSFDPIISC